MTIVSIIWWAQKSGISARGNKECFEDAGCKVEVTDAPTPVTDLVFTPIPGVEYERDVPLLTQLGGYGPSLLLPSSKPHKNIKRTFELSDVVTVLDPNMHVELQRAGMDEETLMAPNASPTTLFPTSNKEGFRVLCPQGDSPMKKPEELIEAIKLVGEAEPEIEFVFPSKSKGWRNPLDWLELDNLRMLPTQPFEGMKKLYARADVILPYSSAEILPTTVFEGLSTGKPVVVKEIGKVQSIHRDSVEEMVTDFGLPSSEFHDRWKGEYHSGEGDHYIGCESSEEAAEAVLRLHEDENYGLEIGSNGLDWLNRYWEPRDRGRKLMEVAGV